ncbi:MAG: alanyl-tRNA editing protein [Rhodospirillales bacterium]
MSNEAMAPKTEEVFRMDAYRKSCAARVTAVKDGSIELDATVFYPTSGGQPGDSGVLITESGATVAVIGCVKDRDSGAHLHLLGDEPHGLTVGDKVTAAIDWDRRYRHMRMHTCLHLICSLIDGSITGAQIGPEKSRIDFDLPDTTIDKEALADRLNALIAADHKVEAGWISDAELDAKPDLVRTLSVAPPRGQGRVRLIDIGGVDLQPCGGTHVRSTAEIGPVLIGKIENKGRLNRRINVLFADSITEGEGAAT